MGKVAKGGAQLADLKRMVKYILGKCDHSLDTSLSRRPVLQNRFCCRQQTLICESGAGSNGIHATSKF